jgi:hypothetical protein
MSQVAARSKAEDNALARRVLSHLHHELASVTVLDEPFQHFYSDRIWPTDVYEQMLRLLPPPDLYDPVNIKVWVNAQGVSTRDRCFMPEVLEKMDAERASFWRQIWLALTAESLKRALFSIFKKDIALRLGLPQNEVKETQTSVTFHMTRDIEDYRIGPHPDGQPHIVTAQFYLAADTSQQDLGTSFYTDVHWLKRPLLGRYQEVKRMPFLPRSGYAFAVNDLPGRRSLHGRELIKSGAGVRHSIIMRWTKRDSERKRGQVGSHTHHLF